MGKTRIYSGCRDCKRCTNPAVANFGRTSGRVGAAASTVGVSELARGFTRNCTGCGHKLSLHGYVYSPEMVRGVPTGIPRQLHEARYLRGRRSTSVYLRVVPA